ncbi:MAG: OmpA family protein [Myxococcota bacterium]|nr:OmpA family protein [Myxococcota bacterium]MDW8362247.1 OmpA family protein [Myxococcales bacterium]
MARVTVSARFGMVIATCLALLACGPSQAEYDAQVARVRALSAELEQARGERAALERRLQELERQNGDLSARLRALGQSVEQLEGDRANLQSSLDETRRALDELRARERQAQARLATFRGMLERFRAMIQEGRLRVRIQRGRMVVELPEGILFDSGEADIKREGEATLAEVARVLASIPNRHFQVCGHTDNVPIRSRRFPSNWELSAARAVNVARFLVASGVSAERISAAGYADTQPVASNDTPEGRQQNRRIEIALVPNLDELPDLSSLEQVQ